LLVIWAGQGLELLLQTAKKWNYLLSCLVGVILLIETARYGYLYFGKYPQNQAVFQPGLPEVIRQLNQAHPTGPVAVVGDGYSYALWSWYLQLSPSRFFETVVKQQPDRIGFRYGQQIDRYHFIMDAADRSNLEPILVEWRDNRWQIKTF
jgi:hypothetical protein